MLLKIDQTVINLAQIKYCQRDIFATDEEEKNYVGISFGDGGEYDLIFMGKEGTSLWRWLCEHCEEVGGKDGDSQ